MNKMRQPEGNVPTTLIRAHASSGRYSDFDAPPSPRCFLSFGFCAAEASLYASLALRVNVLFRGARITMTTIKYVGSPPPSPLFFLLWCTTGCLESTTEPEPGPGAEPRLVISYPASLLCEPLLFQVSLLTYFWPQREMISQYRVPFVLHEVILHFLLTVNLPRLLVHSG